LGKKKKRKKIDPTTAGNWSSFGTLTDSRQKGFGELKLKIGEAVKKSARRLKLIG